MIPANDRTSGPFVCTGGETVLTYDFPVLAAGDLAVRRLRAGAVTLLSLSADYTVSGVGAPGGGNVTLLVAASPADRYIVKGARALARSTQFVEERDIAAAKLNGEYDSQAVQIQELRRDADLAIVFDPLTGAADAGGRRIVNGAAGVAPSDFATVDQISGGAVGFADQAAASAAAAVGSQTAAGVSAASALASQIAAGVSAVAASVSQASAAALVASVAGIPAASATSIAIGTGSKVFTVAAGLAIGAGARMRAVSDASFTSWLEGVVTAYTGTSLTIAADVVAGSGTFAAWHLNFSGAQGSAGPPGTVSGVDSRLTTETIGTVAPIATGSVTGASRFGWVTAATVNGVIEQLRAGVSIAQTGAIEVCSVNGDDTLNLVSSTPVELIVGLNTIALDIPIAAGQVVVLYLPQNGLRFNAQSGLPNYFSVATAISTNTARTIAGGQRLEFGLTLAGEVLGGVHVLRNRMSVVEIAAAALGAATIVGPPNIVASGSVARSGYTEIRPRPAPGNGYISSLSIGVQSAATVLVQAITPNGDGTVTLTASQSVTLAAGLNLNVPCEVPILAGQYPAVYLAGTNIYFQNSVNPEGLPDWYVNGAVTVSTAKTASTAHRFELAFEIRTGVVGDVNKLSKGSAGLGLLDAADKTGIADATALFAAVKAAHPQPYVPPGVYAVTTLPAAGGGFWGPGKIKVSGRRFFIPDSPNRRPLLTRLRADLATQISSKSPLVIVGDSKSHFAYATTGADHWFDLLTRFANIGTSPNDLPGMTALRSSSGGYTPAFYGVTTSGTITTGTAGPISESAILAAGAGLSFAGAYEQVDVCYTQQAGAGSLEFAYNAGAAYKTFSCAGATDLDHYSGPSLTGQTASGTYTITATGGPVEITGLFRLGVKTAGTADRLRTLRAAHGSYTLGSFGSAQVTSIVKQCGIYGGTKPFVLIDLGINDVLGGLTAAQIQTALQTLIDLFQAAGVARIAVLIPFRPTSATAPQLAVYDTMVGLMHDAARAEGLQIIHEGDIDVVGEGLSGDAIHLNDAGMDRWAQMVIEDLAG